MMSRKAHVIRGGAGMVDDFYAEAASWCISRGHWSIVYTFWSGGVTTCNG